MARQPAAADFIRNIIDQDLASGTAERVIVRFPPEPNGFPHIGHAKSSTLNFGLAAEYKGRCHLRFDDTNPATEDQRYVDAIKRDLQWMGFDWGEHEYYASDYFETLFNWACKLILKGLAYVDDSPEEVIREMRGTVTTPGTESPYRNRASEENLELFEAMRAGAFADGSRVLRAKIDMAHPNMKMRDPLMYRIRHATHYRQGDAWCIYPFYDWAHGQSDAIEGVTHSICTLEFSTNRVLYDWYLDALEIAPRPYQYEFARLNLAYTITSKRKLLHLVREGIVDGWDDPRMPTLAGLRRRGVRPQAIKTFCNSIGTTKVDSISDPGLLEHCIRDDLNHRAPRILCVQDPLPITLTNWPEDRTEIISAPYWPHDVPRDGVRPVPFSGELLIERSDFSEKPPKGFRRLTPGGIVRLRHAYIIRCNHVEKDETGKVVRLHCEWIEGTRSGSNTMLKPKGTIHWVDARQSLPIIVRAYNRLFTHSVPGEDFLEALNPSSLIEYKDARIEPSIADDPREQRYQFTRLGFYWRDPEHIDNNLAVFNCIVTLRQAIHGHPEPAQVASKVEKPDEVARPHDAQLERQPKTATPAKNNSKSKQRPLTADEEQWLNKSGLSAATGLAIYGVPAASEFLEAASEHVSRVSVGNWMANQLLPALKGAPLSSLPFGPSEFAELVQLADSGKASTHEARAVLKLMLAGEGSPTKLLAGVQSSTVGDSEILSDIVGNVLSDHEDRVDAYLAGKTGLVGFFVGQVMMRTNGKADPRQTKALIEEELAGRAT